MSNKKALVTGASGMLGRQMVSTLLKAGIKVRAMVRHTSDLTHLDRQLVEIVFGEAGDLKTIRQSVSGIDWLFHLAGYLSVSAPFGVNDQSPNYEAVNVIFTESLLEAAHQLGISRFVYASSSSVYHIDAPVPTPEEAPLGPTSDYGRSKLKAEELILSYQTLGLDSTIIRPAVIYGPGDRYFTPAALTLARLPILPLVNGGKNLFDLVYSRDVATIMLIACQSEAAIGRIYNAGAGYPVSLFDLATCYHRLTGHGPKLLSVSPEFIRSLSWITRPILKILSPGTEAALTEEGIRLMDMDIQLDITRATEELGYQPAYDLEQGLAEILSQENSR